MNITERGSEYEFPIFISSTVYNLVDLRAEIERYLFELGYKPILSSSEGFHDNTPDLPPWESCLEVLQTCFVMVLIIDGRYGDKLDWKAYEHLIGNVKVSATHAEYLFAERTKKRLLVFVREELHSIYQVYRRVYKKHSKDVNAALEEMKSLVPDGIDVDSLEFYRQVKTTNPIPWIKPFKDVTDIKKEIKKKMLNELAITFLLKQEHLETVLKVFSRSIDALPSDKRKEVLQTLNVTQEFQEEIDRKTKENEELKRKLDKLETELNASKKGTGKTKLSEELERKIKAKEKQIQDLKIKIDSNKTFNADLITGSTKLFGTDTHGVFSSLMNIGTASHGYQPHSSFLSVGKTSLINGCENCHSITFGALQTCSTCKRTLCSNCFNGNQIRLGRQLNTCYDCSEKSTAALIK